MLQTVQQFLESQNYPDSLSGGTLEQALKDFAAMHCKAQAKTIYEKARLVKKEIKYSGARAGGSYFVEVIDKDSVLKAYPLSNIR